MSPLEVVATLLGVACVGLTIIRNIWCWPTGLAMVLCYIVIFYQVKLYSDMGLQVVYVGLQVYGWWYWLRGGQRSAEATQGGGVEGAEVAAVVDSESVPVRRLAPARVLAWLAGAALATLALGTLMDRATDADLPYWDATTTVLSLVAQWLMGRKILESWLFWIVVDVLSIGIYAVKGLHLTAGLYALFLGMAIAGFVAWRRALAAPVSDPLPAAI
jgi:nicotinamide mononucleotide transporter